MPAKPRRVKATNYQKLLDKYGISDYGPPERWQHSGRVLQMTEARGVLAAKATEEHIVDVLVTRGVLTESHSTAAFKLKNDYQRARISAPVTGGYNPIRTARDFFRAEHERTDLEEAAYRRWRNALRELDSHTSRAVVDTVCHDAPPLPRDIPLLQAGLEKLARWYGV